MSFTAQGVTVRAGRRTLLRDVSLRLAPGEVHALLGPNGAGKSTLLRVLAGDVAPDQGEVWLNDRPLSAWSLQEQARLRAVLPQAEHLRFGYSARQVVELGRLPGPWAGAAREREIVSNCLAEAGAAALAEQRYPSLSGGERARVQLARVLAQVWPGGAGRCLLLDEPTAHLDLSFQHQTLQVARRFAAGGGAVLVILHDPNLALRYADQVTLLLQGHSWGSGPAQAVLDPETLSRLYGVPVRRHAIPGLPYPLLSTDP